VIRDGADVGRASGLEGGGGGRERRSGKSNAVKKQNLTINSNAPMFKGDFYD
jgi:hypothetical protein